MENKELQLSHIIPESFYDLKNNPRYVAMNSNGKVDKKHYQNGLKEYLLCESCEQKLGNLDKYAKDIFFKKIPECKWKSTNVENIGKVDSYLLQDFNYIKLKKFLISLVWRASISSSNNIYLGKYEDVALKILKDEIDDNPNLFIPMFYRCTQNYHLNDVFYFSPGRCLNQKTVRIRFSKYGLQIVTNGNNLPNNDLKEMQKFFNPTEMVVLENDYAVSNIDNSINDLLIKKLLNCKDFLP